MDSSLASAVGVVGSFSMPLGLHTANQIAIAKVCCDGNAPRPRFRQKDAMDEPGVPNFIRKYRKDAGLTQEALAEALDPPTTKGTISQYESEKRGFSIQRLQQIATVLNVKPGALLDGPPPIPSETQLASMLAAARDEVRDDVTYGGYPSAVASGLHARLVQFVGASSSAAVATTAQETFPGADAQSRRPTKRAAGE